MNGVVKDLKTISQVSKSYGIDEYTLRYWDKLGILSPRRVGAMRVYGAEEEQKIRYILRWIEEGYRPSEIKNFLMAASWVDERSVSQTKALHEMLGKAQRGEVVSEAFGISSYNTVYRRLERAVKKSGKKARIKMSEDRKKLEAKII